MSEPRGPDPVLDALNLRLRRFAAGRDWDRFHSPKNLAMAFIVEAAELVEHFQWLTDAESVSLPQGTRKEVELELADVLNYTVRLADKLGIDLPEAVDKKIALNEQKYPAEQVRGSVKKHTEYREKEIS
ncbi:MAG TPA: nucleotide pyrophosphohydrolase [Gammaproteobacteria bacterium]|nr:nucleotide pyrophosphohydrolase [Gammaproteobacteria bacterium]